MGNPYFIAQETSMEINQVEIDVVKQADADCVELSELQLALVGGGSTDVTFH